MNDGDTFTHNGNTFRVAFPFDDTQDAPWEREEGHGPVSNLPARANGFGCASKRAGQRELGEHWLYDFAEACRIARRDGWRAPSDVDRTGMTPRQLAARAAEADFQRLDAWCRDVWCYVGCVVTLLDDDGDATDFTASLWGIESDASDYLEEVARELAEEIIHGITHAARVA